MNFELMKNFMDRLAETHAPGNSISVYKDNKEVFSYQTGYADLENKIPMTADKLFNIYSCSKVTTVAAALHLYERGFFLLDDPVYEFIPEFKEMTIRRADGELVKAQNPITIRNLFTMTSGLTYNTATDAFKKARELTDGKMDTVTVAKCIAADPLSFEPGTRWQYSLSHDVLVAVVEVISGKKFRDYVKENFWEPLGMNDSFYHNEKVQDRMAQQYIFNTYTDEELVNLQTHSRSGVKGKIENIGLDNGFIFGSEYDSGGAGITTSVGDYAKFCSALANFGVGPNGERILSAGTVDLLRTNQICGQPLADLNWQQLKGYGYGLGVRTLIDKAASGSTGALKEFGWGGAAGATVLCDADNNVSLFFAQHMMNPDETYYQPRLRNVLYACLD